MTSAYIEPRPKSKEVGARIDSHVVVVDHKEVFEHKTQKAATDWAKEQGYVVHVARERHLVDRDNPDHWRKD